MVEFKKAEWNRLDTHMFAAFLVPTLQHKAPHMSLETSIARARSEDLETHDLGVRILSARHYQASEMWTTLLELFRRRDPAHLTPHVWIALVKMIGHHDDNYSYRDVPDEVKGSVRQKILKFGAVEMAKLLFYVDDGYGFDRPSSGYSLIALFGARADSREIIAAIRDDPAVDQETRDKAARLTAMEEEDPNWFKWWRKDE